MDTRTLELEITEEALDQSLERELVLFNDDHNAAEHVVRLLMKVCRFDYERATACTLEAHQNGHATLMVGVFNELKPYREGICKGGVWAEIL
ncbi:MAG: ATP-dependent Clp protease adaptor ClpS [Bernardetiaceae bacterium]